MSQMSVQYIRSIPFDVRSTVKRLIEFSLGDGNTILVEVEEPQASDRGQTLVSRHGKMVAQAKQSFEEAIDKIKPVAETIITKLRDLSELPDEVEVKFGVKMSAEAGVVLTSAGVEANYEITLKWHK
jgi:hypothetical protein